MTGLASWGGQLKTSGSHELGRTRQVGVTRYADGDMTAFVLAVADRGMPHWLDRRTDR